jgi:hypothetical protein
MTVLSGVQTYIKTYSPLSGLPVLIDFLASTPSQYAILPMPGSRTIEKYINGGSRRQFNFALQSVESTADDLERLDNVGFFETFADWLESQTKAGTLPSLGTGKTATEIEAMNWGYLFQQGDSSTGIYQIICRLEYEQAA